jgi:hypothetical protein
MTKDLPSPELLRKLLRYEPQTGKLFWLPRPAEMFLDQRFFKMWHTKYANKTAFTAITAAGYKTGRIYHKTHYAHRVIWAIVHGGWPVGEIDHINGVPADNRLGNLRRVFRDINARNVKMRSDNTSGYNGVYWHASTGKWAARISIDCVNKHLGLFNNIADAIAARKAAEVGNGYTERHGQ